MRYVGQLWANNRTSHLDYSRGGSRHTVDPITYSRLTMYIFRLIFCVFESMKGGQGWCVGSGKTPPLLGTDLCQTPRHNLPYYYLITNVMLTNSNCLTTCHMESSWLGYFPGYLGEGQTARLRGREESQVSRGEILQMKLVWFTV